MTHADAPRIAPAPIGVATAIVSGAAALTQGAIATACVGFLGILLVLFGIEEVLGPDPRTSPAAGAAFGGILVVGAIGGVLEPVRIATERVLRMRGAIALIRTPGAAMPPAVERGAIARGPITVVSGLLATVMACLAFVALIVGGAGLTEDRWSMVVLALGLVLVVVGLGLVRSRVRRAHAWWSNDLGRLRVAWPAYTSSDAPHGATMVRERSAKTRRLHPLTARWRRAAPDRILTGLLVVAVVVASVGVVARHQCDGCAPLAVAPFGASSADGILAVGLALVALSVAAWIVRAIVGWIVEVVREVRTAAAARRGAVARSTWLDRARIRPRSLELVGRALGAVAAALAVLWVGAAATSSASDDADPDLAIVRAWADLGPLVGVAALAALVVGMLGVVAARRWRLVVEPAVDGDPYPGLVHEPTRQAPR